MYDYSSVTYDFPTANKIVEEFRYIINLVDYDELPLDIDDLDRILEYIEDELRDDALLILTNGQIMNIRQNIIRIIFEHNPTNSMADSFMFRVRYYCIENDIEFRKLYRFNTNQLKERGAEMHWRDKCNNFKDYRLDFEQCRKL